MVQLKDGYDRYSIDFFLIDGNHKIIKEWPLRIIRGDSAITLERIKRRFQCGFKSEIVDFDARIIPRHYARSVFDHAFILILWLADGTIVAKRHNNNQFFSL